MHKSKLLLWTLMSTLSLPLLRCQSQSITNESASKPPPRPLPEFEGARECPQGSDKLLSDCFKIALDDYNQWSAAGISTIDLPSTDPILVPDISFRVVGDLRYTWTNIRLHGATKPSDDDLELEINTKNKTIYMSNKFPLLRVTADYKRTGHLLWLSLRDMGNVELNVTNLRSTQIILLKIVEQGGGEPALRIHEIQFGKIEAEDVRSHVSNLADSGLWGQIINSLISRNMKWIYKTFIEPGLKERMLQFANVYWRRVIPATLSASYFIIRD